jgi:PemK-like, MazF-like toxin of type II toxin-antitoxin system
MYLIRIIPFPFLEKEGFKLRPVVQLSEVDEYGTAVCAYVSTKPSNSNYSILLTTLKGTGLEEKCFIHANKLYTLPVEESEVIGKLGEKDTLKLKEKLKKVLTITD